MGALNFKKERYSFIYRLVSPSEKSYIGFTTRHPLDRWHEHKRYAKRGCKGKLYNAIRKYQPENFTLELLYRGEDTEHTLKVMESYFIEKYKAQTSLGYNLCKGGFGNTSPTRSKRQKKLLSKKLKYLRQNFPELWEAGRFSPKRKIYGSKRWEITFPDGHKEIIWNLREFCRQNNLPQSGMQVAATQIPKRVAVRKCYGYSLKKLED